MGGYDGVPEASNIWEVWGFFTGDTVYFPKAGIPANRVRPYTVISTEPFAVSSGSPLSDLFPTVHTTREAARLGITKEPPVHVLAAHNSSDKEG